MYSHILVPLDGSQAAEIVLPYAVEVAARYRSKVSLVSVSEPMVDDRDPLYRSYLERIAERWLRSMEDRGAGGQIEVKIDVLLGSPADEILRYADAAKVDLIVMASRGRSGQGPWLLGHIAAKVLRATDRPVLLIRAPVREESLLGKERVRRILLPLDGSTVGESAIPYAESLAQAMDAEIILFQVLRPTVIVSGEGVAMPSVLYREEEEVRANSAMAYLDRIGERLREKGIRTSIALKSGSPADQIIDYAEATGIDLIAISTHGRSGIGRWVFGSVTDKILHAGDTPVLTIRASRGS